MSYFKFKFKLFFLNFKKELHGKKNLGLFDIGITKEEEKKKKIQMRNQYIVI
jgi:hypothetical protein